VLNKSNNIHGKRVESKEKGSGAAAAADGLMSLVMTKKVLDG
jgi:hypothetical protein